MAVRQPYPNRQSLTESMHKTYPVGNGSVRLFIDKHRDPHGYWERIDISLTDSVVDNGGSGGSAKFNLTLIDHDMRGTRWILTSNYSGSFLSRGTNTVQGPAEREHEWHFYGGRDKLRGGFYLEKDGDSRAWAVAQLLFGFDREVVHVITLTIWNRGNTLVPDIDGPTIQTRSQLQPVAQAIAYINSRAEDETEERMSKKECGTGLETLGLIKTAGSSLNGLGNGSVWNIKELNYGPKKEG